MRTIRVGSRESRLAVVQAELVMEAIRRDSPSLKLELVTMKTTGDRILDRTLDKVGGKGLFVKELDQALLEGKVDLCVHSYKDMPVEENPELPVVAVSPREDPRDALVLPQGREEPDRDRPVGCASLRRKLQLELLYPGWACRPVRGNVLTRLEKLDRGEYGGLVLAAAGLRRLGLWSRVARAFSVEELVPSSCQGILAVQGRKGEDFGFLRGFHCAEAWDASQAERAFLRELDGGCSTPVAAHARISGRELRLDGLYVDDLGRIHWGSLGGAREEGVRLGTELAQRLRSGGSA